MLSFTRKRLVIALVFFCCALFALAKFASTGKAGVGSTMLVPSLTANNQDSITTDVDGDLRADPGDTVQYTVTINNAGTDATGVSFMDTLDANMTLVGGYYPANLDSAWLENMQRITDGKAAQSVPLLAYVVNSNGDTNAVNLVTGTDAGGNITLRSAIQAANTQPGSHTITFSGAVVSPINLTLGQITVGNAANGNNITITGPGMNLLTVNQTTENRIFSTGTGAVTFLLRDITLNYAGPAVTPYSGGGGAIIAGGAGAATTLINCRISNFQRQIGNGGAISASSSLNNHSLTITNSIFTNNRAGGAGGAVSFNSQGGTATITGNTFTNNHTGPVGANTGGDGGAINLSGGGSGGTYLVEKNTFLTNQVENVTGHAGAVMSTNGTATIRYNRFIGNTCANTSFPPLANIVGQAGGATIHTTIADNNWWGVNTGPGPNDATALAAGAVMTLTNWLQLRNTPSPAPIVTGQTTTLTASVNLNSAGTDVSANVDVLLGLPLTFSNPVRGALSGSGTVIQVSGAGKGTATSTFRASSAGAGSADATVDSAIATAAITINKANTTASITNNPATTVVGQGYTVNFSLAVNAPGSNNPTVPTGNVQVSDGSQTCTGAINAAGTGSCLLTSFTAGNKTLTATYQGDANFNVSPASAGVAHTVNKADTTTTITNAVALQTATVVGQSYPVTWSVTVNLPGSVGAALTGNVTVSDGSQTCLAAVSALTCNLTSTTPGAKTITATYAGDANYNASPTSPGVAHTVNKANTTVALGTSGTPSVFGQSVTFTATITVTLPGAGSPTGNITFKDNSVDIGTCAAQTVAANIATCSISTFSVATHPITAVYNGNTNFNASPASSILNQIVNKANTTTAITTDNPDPSVTGQNVVVNFTVVPIAPGAGTPTGNVVITVSGGAETCTDSIASGTCTITLTAAGARTITATYAGDANFNGGSDTEPHQINKADTLTTITSDNPDPSVTTQSVTVNYNVTVTIPGAGSPTGNVMVTDGVNSCMGTVADGNCMVTLTTAGNRTLTATYMGDSNFNASPASAGEPHSVTAPTPTATNTPTNTPTDTPTPTATATDTPTATPTAAAISGTVTYGNAIGNPVPPRFVKNVSLSSTSGSPSVGPVITGTPGTYTLTGFGAGSYTIKPSKPGGSNGAITSNDAARVAQGVSGAVDFASQNQRFAADVSGNGGVTSNDAALIARFAAGLTGTGNAGQWKFFVTGAPSPLPTAPQTYDDSRTYASVTSNVTGEDFVGILVGEVSGNWNPANHPRPGGRVESGESRVESEDGETAESIRVTVQEVVTAAEKELVVPVNVQGVADKGIISYEFDLRYDPSVIQPLADPVDVAGTVSRGLMVVANPNKPGLLRVVVYGPIPIYENGVLLNLRFTALGTAGSVSPMTWERIMFNEGESQVAVTDGRVELF